MNPDEPLDFPHDNSTVAHARQIDVICDRFESAWKAALNGGPLPRPEDYGQSAELIAELILLDQHYRHRLAQEGPGGNLDTPSSPVLRAGEETIDSIVLPRDLEADVLGPFGEYDLLEEIARGGMGVVYRARHRRLGRVCALKRILAGRLASAVEVHRFRTEASTASTLDHPHVVPIFEVGEHEGHHFFTMRLIEGPNLKQLLPRLTNQPTLSAFLMVKIAEAVHYAHSKAILHRDLKPANILLEGDPEGPGDRLIPYVTDFGLAKSLTGGSDLTQSDALLGTPAYASPEQAAGKVRAISTATDIYGLGAVLYTLLTGKPPFDRPTVAEILASVQHDEPRRPRELNPAVPIDLETICLKALQKEQGQRYSSAAEFAADLQRYLAGEPIRARPVGVAERLMKWVFRQPVIALLVTLLVVVSLIGLGTVLWKWRDAEDHRQRADTKAKAESEALGRLRVSEYYQRVARALLEFEANNVLAAESTLASCDPSLRGWEWHYTYSLCHHAFASIPTPGSGPYALAFSSDCRYLAVSTGEGNVIHEPKLSPQFMPPQILLIDVKTGQTLQTFKGPIQQIRDLRFSPDGRILYGCGGDWAVVTPGEMWAWDTSTGEVVWNLPMKTNAWRIDLTSDGRLLAIATGRSLQLWNTATRKRLSTITISAGVHCVAFSPKGTQIATGQRDGVRLYETATGKDVTPKMSLPKIDTRSIDWHPQDNFLAVGTYSGKGFLVEMNRGSVVTMMDGLGDVNKGVNRVAFTGNGQRLVMTCADGSVHVWRLPTRAKMAVLRGHSRGILGLALSPGGHLIATASDSRMIKIWDEADLRPFTSDESLGRIQSLARLSEGRLVSCGHQREGRDKSGRVTLWDGAEGRVLKTLDERVGGFLSIATSSSDWIAHDYDRDIKVLRPNGEQWRPWMTLSGHTSAVSALVFHPTRAELISGGTDGTVKIWRWGTGAEPRLAPPIDLPATRSPIVGLAYMPGGEQLVSAEQNGVVSIWETSTQRLLASWRATTNSLTALALHPTGGQLALGSQGGEIDLWTWPDQQHRGQLKAHAEAVMSLAYSPDGQRLASTGRDWDVSLWDPHLVQMVISFRHTTNEPRALLFSQDGEQLIVGTGARLKVWDATPPEARKNQRIAQWHRHEGIAASLRGAHEGAVIHLKEAAQSNPHDRTVAIYLAWSLAEMRRYEEAFNLWGQTTRGRPPPDDLNGNHWRENWLAMAFGSPELRRTITSALLSRYKNSSSITLRHHAGVICTYRPDSLTDPDAVVRLLQMPTEKEPDKSYHWEVLAAAHLRAGQYREAITAAAQVRKTQRGGRGLDSYIEVVAYTRLKEPARALAAFATGEMFLPLYGDFERRSGTRYLDFSSFRNEARRELGLGTPLR